MKYTQLTDAQLTEMRKAQLLQFESDHARQQLRADIAAAVVADPNVSNQAKDAAQNELNQAQEMQAQLDIAHAEVLNTLTNVEAFKEDLSS